MMPSDARTILGLLDGGVVSASLGAALELGLFQLLNDGPLSVEAIARRLGIPPLRCAYWIQVLEQAGLVREGPDGLLPSPMARTAISDAYSRETWAFLAREARERLPVFVDLGRSLVHDGLHGPLPGARRPDYVTLMAADAVRARQFTRMLYELHRPMAEELCRRVDATAVARLLDIGGGSGIVSLTFARRYPRLTATVVDLATVCAAGRELAEACGLGDRVAYCAADFTREDLPCGFDLALMCDVGVYEQAVFDRIRAALKRPGRLLVADAFAPPGALAPASRVVWAFERSLADPGYVPPAADHVKSLIAAAGFRIRSCDDLRLPDDRDPVTLLMAECE